MADANIDHSSRDHALLSASSSARWMSCTPSARLEEKFMQSQKTPQTTSYAEEGTLAHEFGDVNLRYLNGEIAKETLTEELNALRKNEHYYNGMEDEVEKYTSYIWEEFLETKKHDKFGAELKIETKAVFDHIVPQGFGSNDAIVLGSGRLFVGDLKFGMNEVSAIENPQLMLYAVGALKEYDPELFDIETVVLAIVQPRISNYSRWEISVKDLMTWATKQVKPKAKKAWEGKGKQVAGDHCKYCKVKATCATIAAQNLKLARHEFKDPHHLSDKQVLEVYKQTDMLIDWAKAVGKYILDTAKSGDKTWPGFKVVEGRSQRKIINDDEVKKILKDGGFKEEQYIKSSLEGIGKLEKLLGKPEFKKLLGKHVVKPAGAPTLVPETDKRPALGIDKAQDEFDILD